MRGVQCFFLEEPCAFFDLNRMYKGIEALNAVGNAFGPVWLVAQSYPDCIGLDFSVSLSREPGREVLIHD